VTQHTLQIIPDGKPFSPDDLAGRWEVSATTVRNMCMETNLN